MLKSQLTLTKDLVSCCMESVTFALPEDLDDDLERMAAERRVSKEELILEALKQRAEVSLIVRKDEVTA